MGHPGERSASGRFPPRSPPTPLIMFELKSLSPDAIPAALEKAVRYRLLNEPGEAESICLDVLAVEPGNQKALVTLLLAMTDRFGEGCTFNNTRIQGLIDRIQDDYERCYYAGIVRERNGKCRLRLNSPGTGTAAYELLREAMEFYEQAEKIRPAGNDDALLRWNACARLIMSQHLHAPAVERYEPALE